ncbi:MAG: hypothetical protein PVF75_10660 [Granulosicoccaceae bacterium]|jgi:hypothetical protein
MLYDAPGTVDVSAASFTGISPWLSGRHKRGVPVHSREQFAHADKRFILGTVARRGIREKIRALLALHKQEGEDFQFVARGAL